MDRRESMVAALTACVLLAAPLAWLAPRAAHASGGVLHFRVTKLAHSRGTLRCVLYDDEDAYPTEPDKAVAKSAARISGRSATCVFRGVAPGTYALAAYHDEDDDGEIDTNFLGIPSEDMVASRNATGTMGPPDFEDAKFVFRGKKMIQRATMDD